MNRNKLGIILGVALGVVAALFALNYTQQLQRQLQQAQQQAQRPVAAAQTPVPTPTIATVPVVVAAQDLAPQSVLSTAAVKVIQVPPDVRLARALTRPDDAVGKVVQYPVAAGEQIVPLMLASAKTSANFSVTIPPGKRAVAIKVDEIIGTADLIRPGDRVDVIATFDKQTMGKDMATLFLQNVEVLAVAQHYAGEPPEVSESAATPAPALPGKTTDAPAELGAAVPLANASSKGTPTAAATPKPTPTATATPRPTPVPAPRTLTLAVTPEEAERLALAEANGSLRLALRPASDASTDDIPEATLSTLQSQIVKPAAQITGVQISPTNLRAGDTLKVVVTVKNTSDKVIATQDPKPEFTYVQGQTYHSQGFTSQDGKLRVGLNFDGHPSAPFPYRWGLGGDLAPGSTVTVTGYVKLTYDLKPTNFWVGLVQEPSTVLQDNEGTTLVTVLPENVAVVSVDAANVRSGPDLASSVIDQLPYGTEVPIMGQEKDWFKVQLPDGSSGFVAAGWIIAPTANAPPAPVPAVPMPAALAAASLSGPTPTPGPQR